MEVVEKWPTLRILEHEMNTYIVWSRALYMHACLYYTN